MGTRIQAKNLSVSEELEVGTEDRVFSAFITRDGGHEYWWYQLRGTPDAFGPYETREAAEYAYSALQHS